MPLRSFCLTTLVAVTAADCSTTCRRHQPCWPSKKEVKALHDALDPNAKRTLHWSGPKEPLPAPTPLGSNQPLFGSNQNLKPLYEQSHDDSWECLVDTFYCRQATRNHPMKGDEPAFVAWPLNVDHVQKLLRFAKDHNLGVSVAGTGHDFLNRHSCHQGIFIRMSLMKGIEWNLTGTDGGSVRVGPGVNFGEIMFSGKDQQPPSHTMAGWVGTVGVVGWALGGGHGPFGRSGGFGAENTLALEVVTADGEVVTASAESHQDLFWAMRGGGGSTWGVVTGVTFKAYTTPPHGVALAVIVASGDACPEGMRGYDAVAHGWANWTAELGPRFSGMFNVEILPTPDPLACFGSWQHYMIYAFDGAHNDEELHSELKRLTASFNKNLSPSWRVTPPVVEKLSHWWNYEKRTRIVDKIWTTPFKAKNVEFDPKVVASVAVAGEKRELMASKLVSAGKDHFKQHHYGSFMVYHDIPGLACPARPRPPPNSTALGRQFRDADFHLILGRSMNHKTRDFWSELGSGAYFGESAYGMEDWKQQYWGDHYDNLLQVKRQYDPENLFWCHNCVGSDQPRATQEFDVRVEGEEVSV